MIKLLNEVLTLSSASSARPSASMTRCSSSESCNEIYRKFHHFKLDVVLN